LRPLLRLALVVAPPIYRAYMRLVFATSQVELGDFPRLHAIRDEHDGVVVLLWHEEVFTVGYGYGVVAGFHPHTLASSGDVGEVVTRVLQRCGFVVFRGGSSRHRSRRRHTVLVEMIRHMKQSPGVLYGITVDGSRGPAYRIKPGALLVAARCEKPVVLARTWYRRCLRLPTWDRTAIPLPFNQIVYYLRGPYFVSADARDGEALEPLRRRLEQELIDLAAESYDEMGQPRPTRLKQAEAVSRRTCSAASPSVTLHSPHPTAPGETPMPPSIEEVHQTLTGPGAPFEVVEEEIRGVPTRVWKNAPPSLRSILDTSRLHGDKTFLVYEDERLSFEEHYRAAATLARRLVEDWGVRKGDRIAIAMRNYPEWSIAFWATAAAGAVAVPLNAWWKGEELEYGLRDSGSSLLFCDAQRASVLQPHLAGLGLRAVVVTRSERGLAPGCLSFDEVLGTPEADATPPDVALDPEDDATIFYTSGTTGNPKGALGTHRNICSNLLSLAFSQARGALRSGVKPVDGEERPQLAQLISVPFFHATGCHTILVGNLAFGGKLVMMYKWDPERALELIERERLTSFGGVPAMVWQVLESPGFSTRDLSSVRSVGYGGAPAPPELVRRVKEAFPGGSAANGYGLTETSSISTFNAGEDYVRRPDSVGPPVAVCEVKVVDEKERELPVGEVGELWIKGPNVVKGYWNKPEATDESFTDGWLHSGDLGRVDEEGFVYIVDRAKDMVIRGGENVYCVEVESVLYDHPEVMDAAVVGIPHRVLGEEVGAVGQLTPGSALTEEALREHVTGRLASFKVPVRIEIRSEPLPRNANGKILKRDLKESLAAAGA
jgi:long-chain acyl-CoA synthetase